MVLAFVCAMTVTARRAYSEPAKQNAVTLNPIRYGLLHFQVEYERRATDKLDWFVSPIVFHHATWYPFAHVDNTTADGFGLDFGMRYFVTGAALEGAFVGPFLSAYHGSEHRAGMTHSGYIFSPGAHAGYSAVVHRWLMLSASAGASYGFPTLEAEPGSPHGAGLPHAKFWINFRTNVGFAF